MDTTFPIREHPIFICRGGGYFFKGGGLLSEQFRGGGKTSLEQFSGSKTFFWAIVYFFTFYSFLGEFEHVMCHFVEMLGCKLFWENLRVGVKLFFGKY